MQYTIRKISKEYLRANISLETYMVNEKIIFYILNNQRVYLVFKTLDPVFNFFESNGMRKECFEIAESEYNDDNYLISLFVKDFSKFTDEDLIDELRRRNYAMSIWGLDDIDNVIDNLIKDDPKQFSMLTIHKEDKIKILRDLFEHSDKNADFEMIREKVVEQADKFPWE